MESAGVGASRPQTPATTRLWAILPAGPAVLRSIRARDRNSLSDDLFTSRFAWQGAGKVDRVVYIARLDRADPRAALTLLTEALLPPQRRRRPLGGLLDDPPATGG